MDDRQRRLMEDLSGSFKGELRCDPLTLAMYASDASIFQVTPLAVARPADRDDVVALARYASENGLPLVPRGAGTGVAGAAIGDGVVVDFSQRMRAVESIGESTVRVQPGVVRDQLNRLLRPYGRYFPPDPSNTAITTIGGMLGVDAAGSHSVRVGSTRDHVQSIETVLADGTVIEFGDEPLAEIRPEIVTAAASGDGSADGSPGNGQAHAAKRDDCDPARVALGRKQRDHPSQAAAADSQQRGLLRARLALGRSREHPSLARRFRRDVGTVYQCHAADRFRCRRIEPPHSCCSATWNRPRGPSRRLATWSRAPAI